jgi:hypothetical protein
MQIPHSGARFIQYISWRRKNIFSFDSSLLEQIFLPKLHHSENDVVQTRTREKGRGVIDLITAWRYGHTETVFLKI